jgi:hypothetical protein
MRKLTPPTSVPRRSGTDRPVLPGLRAGGCRALRAGELGTPGAHNRLQVAGPAGSAQISAHGCHPSRGAETMTW